MGIRDVLRGRLPGSDIPGNYPLLFGIAGNDLDLVGTIPLVHAVEARSLSPVRLENITHLEVPLANVEETRKLLNEKDIQVPVIPLEYADAHMSGIALQELAYD